MTRPMLDCREVYQNSARFASFPGTWARADRRDRRPTLPVESPWSFYPRYVFDLFYKHIKLAELILHYSAFRRQLKRDPNARNYTDLALTPVHEDRSEEMELVAMGAPAKPQLVKIS